MYRLLRNLDKTGKRGRYLKRAAGTRGHFLEEGKQHRPGASEEGKH